MKKVTKKDMLNIKGGLAFTASFLSSFVRGVNAFMDIGRSFGSSIRRISAGKACPL